MLFLIKSILATREHQKYSYVLLKLYFLPALLLKSKKAPYNKLVEALAAGIEILLSALYLQAYTSSLFFLF